jgi:hypothetical protein
MAKIEITRRLAACTPGQISPSASIAERKIGSVRTPQFG